MKKLKPRVFTVVPPTMSLVPYVTVDKIARERDEVADELAVVAGERDAAVTRLALLEKELLATKGALLEAETERDGFADAFNHHHLVFCLMREFERNRGAGLEALVERAKVISDRLHPLPPSAIGPMFAFEQQMKAKAAAKDGAAAADKKTE